MCRGRNFLDGASVKQSAGSATAERGTEKRSDMNKKAVIGATAAAIVIIIGAVAFTQGARLKAAASVAKSATMGEEQATAKSDENTQITQEIQDQYQIPEIALTPELQAAIADGTMTVEEAAAQLLSGGDASRTTEAVEETRRPDADAQAEPSAPTEEPPQAEPSAQVEETPEPSKQTEETPAKTAEEAPKAEPSKPVEETPAPSKPAETPKAQTQAPETASLSGETDSGQTQAATDAGQSKATDSGQSQAATATDSGQSQATDSGQTQAPEKSAEEKAAEERNAKVQSLFAQLYVLRDSFSSRVDGIIAECIQEYLKLDPSKQTKVNRIRIVYARMDDLEAMEADCNAQVENIASQLDEIDPALGEKARQYYQNEKELKKASLIAQYGG